MGGYGAVKIALNRPEKYEAVASLSGVLDYVGFTEMVLAGNWEDMSPQEIQSFHGEAGKPEEWENPLFLVEKLAKDENRPRLIQFCGTEDFLYENNLLHSVEKFLTANRFCTDPHLLLPIAHSIGR